MDSGFPDTAGFPSRLNDFQSVKATRDWSLWRPRSPSVEQGAGMSSVPKSGGFADISCHAIPDPRNMTAKDWHKVLYPLPVWRGWSVNQTNGSLREADHTGTSFCVVRHVFIDFVIQLRIDTYVLRICLLIVFEPNGARRRSLPVFEIVPGAGERRHWRIENSFDDTLSHNGFQQIGAHASL